MARMATDRDAAGELRDALVQLSFEIAAVLGRVAAQHDLSLTQLRMLGVMRGRTPRMAELADFLGLDRSTVSGLIDRATRRGLVRRAGLGDAADGRAVHVALTDEGERLGGEIADEVSTAVAPLTDRLTPAQQRRIVVLVGRMLGDPSTDL